MPFGFVNNPEGPMRTVAKAMNMEDDQEQAKAIQVIHLCFAVDNTTKFGESMEPRLHPPDTTEAILTQLRRYSGVPWESTR
jgi:hypothetical protein